MPMNTQSVRVCLGGGIALALLTAFSAPDPMSAPERKAFADGLQSRGLHELAVREYEALLRDAPDFAEKDVVLFRLGESLRSQGRNEEADRRFESLLAECPSSVYRDRARFQRGAVAVAAERFGDAAGHFNALLSSGVSGEMREDALYYCAESESKSGQDAGAVAHFEAFLKEFPSSRYVPYSKVSLATALERTGGDVARAKALLREVASGSDAALAAESLYLLAQGDFVRGDFAASADGFAELRRRFPESKRTAEAALRSAWAAERADRPAEVLSAAESALADPKVAKRDEWLFLKGRAEFRLEKFADAAKSTAAVINEFDTSEFMASAAYVCAQSERRLKRYREAVAMAVLIPADDPYRPQVLRLLADCHAETGDIAKSVACYRELVEKFPDDEYAEDSTFRLARQSQAQKDWKAAAETYAGFVRRFPASELAGRAKYAEGICRKAGGDPAGAVAAWDAMLAAYPSDGQAAEARFAKGVEEYALERWDAALATFDAYLAAGGPKAPAVRFWRASLLSQKGEFAKAVDAFKETLAAGGEGVPVPEVHYQLWFAYQKLEKLDEAADELGAVLADASMASRLKPTQVSWAVEHQYFRKKYPEAEAAARFLLSKAPDASWRQTAGTWVGRVCAARGDDAGAEAAYQAAADEGKVSRYAAEAALRAGEYRLKAGDAESAEKRFDAAMQASQNEELADVRVHATVGLARAWKALGKKSDAARLLLGVCLMNRDDTYIPSVIRETVPLLRELGRDEEARVLEEELASMTSGNNGGEEAAP